MTAEEENADMVHISSQGATIRQHVIVAITNTLRSMTDRNQPVWHSVYTGDIDSIENPSTPCVSIEEGEETVREMYGGCTRKDLNVIFTFRWKSKRGLDAIDVYKYYLGLLQRALLPLHEDEVNHPYLLDIKEDHNLPYYRGQDDPMPGGALVVVVNYEHARNDPYRRAGE